MNHAGRKSLQTTQVSRRNTTVSEQVLEQGLKRQQTLGRPAVLRLKHAKNPLFLRLIAREHATTGAF
jgi:hypothetical protein